MRRIVIAKMFVTGILGSSLLVGTAACTPGAAMPVPTQSSTNSSTASSGPPALAPDGTAADNLPYFDAVNQALLVKTPKPDGRAFIDSLISAGFTKGDMEVTPDKTAIGLDRDNIQFSVKFGQDCLIGQFGNVGYHSVVAPVLQTGKCLIGVTRAIDW